MFKRGVTERGAFAQRTLELERQHRIWRPFSYAMLAEIVDDYSPADEPLLERLYQSMSAGDGVFKITRRGRFEQLDAMLVKRCGTHFPDARVLVVHDVGASNGITALELFRRLNAQRLAEVHASDWYDCLYLVSVPGSGWKVVFDSQGEPLQIVGGKWVLPSARRPLWRHVVNRALQHWAVRKILPIAARILSQGDAAGASVRRIPLFHPECLREAGKGQGFHLGRHDIFGSDSFPCHIVRALNLLTTKHFPADRVVCGITRLARGLMPEGWMVLGRSVDEEDGRFRGTVFVLQNQRLEPLWHLNEGYEDIDLVLQDKTLSGELG